MDMTPTNLHKATGLSVAYCSQMLNGIRNPSREAAYLIHEKTGLKLGHLRNLSDSEVGLMRKLEERAA
jgi:Helix-turn-helix